MNKRDLVGKIAASTGLTRVQAARALETFVEVVRASLCSGNKVTISGFGTFAVSRHKQRLVRDPHRGVPMTIAARTVPRFAPGIELRVAVASLGTDTQKREEESALDTRSPG